MTEEQPTSQEKEKKTVKQESANDNALEKTLKAELQVAEEKKEASFKKKQEVGNKIAEKIKQVNDFKKDRNELTKEVRELKKRRDELNKEINERVQEIKKLTGGKPIPRRNKRDPQGPGFLKKKIEQLEFKLETEPMGFESEQKLNKEIRDLQKQVKEKTGDFEDLEGVMEKSKEIDRLKKEANELHAKVTKLAQQSQKHHEELINYSKDIEDLKKEEEELYTQFLEEKKTFSEVNAKLKNHLGIAHEEQKIERKERQVARKKKDEQDQQTLKERAQEVEEKVKKKQKLTTEDLLALQGMK